MFIEFAAWLQSTAPSLTIQTVTWIVPLTQSVHILTIGVVFVSILIVTLRIFGIAPTEESFDTVARRFGRVIGYGLLIMAASGVVLVIGEPLRQFTTLSFWLKMTLLAIGVGSGSAFLKTLRTARGSTPATEFTSTTKSAAIATVLLWVCIIYLGRAIAYDIEVWESYSLAAEPPSEQPE